MTTNGEAISQTAADADLASLEWVERLRKEADGDDWQFLRLLAENLAATERHATRVREARTATVVRMRDAGIPMKDIAEAAGVTDSILARQTIASGAPRRVVRTDQHRRPHPDDAAEEIP